jgi:hypothetical protein
MSNTKHYDNLKAVPANALKEITFGKLKGKSDINPQWRIEAMTKEFGVCGIGWKYEIARDWTQSAPDNQLLLFVQINLYIKDGDQWSDPIPAIGGDYVLEKDKNGLHGNDEAYKMATTDALGVAMKMLGVAADVYRGLANDSKYGREKPESQQPAPRQQSAPPPNKSQQANTPVALVDEPKIKNLLAKIGKESITSQDLHLLIKWKYGIDSVGALTIPNYAELMNNLAKLWQEYVADQSKAG